MLKTDKNKEDYIFILDNLRDEDFSELKALWKSDWKTNTLKNLEHTDVLVLYGNDGKHNEVPVAMGGFYDISAKNLRIACVWLLTTKFVKYNRKSLFLTLKSRIEQGEKDYDLMYNYIYKSNYKAKRWLSKFGFRFDNPRPVYLKLEKDFEFFYKLKPERNTNVYY